MKTVYNMCVDIFHLFLKMNQYFPIKQKIFKAYEVFYFPQPDAF